MENPFQTERPVRSTLLTVLCILTFIGSGWSALSNLFQLLFFNAADMSMQMQQFSTMGEGDMPGIMGMLFSSSNQLLATIVQHGTAIYSLGFLFSLLSLSGAILMFKLKKIGFIVYVFAQIASLLIMPCFAGFTMVVMVSMFTSLLFSVLFIVLYAVNLKQMK